MRTVVYAAEIDDRYGAGKVSSRIGLSSPPNCLTRIHRCMKRLQPIMRVNLFIACWWMNAVFNPAAGL